MWIKLSKSSSRTEAKGYALARVIDSLLVHTHHARVVQKAVVQDAIKRGLLKEGGEEAVKLANLQNKDFGRIVAGMLAVLVGKDVPVDYLQACKLHKVEKKLIKQPPEGSVPYFLKLNATGQREKWGKLGGKCYDCNAYGSATWQSALYTFLVYDLLHISSYPSQHLTYLHCCCSGVQRYPHRHPVPPAVLQGPDRPSFSFCAMCQSSP
jgi:hypothetical protein